MCQYLTHILFSLNSDLQRLIIYYIIFYMSKDKKKQFNYSNYSVMDVNKSFFYVILMNILSPLVLWTLMFVAFIPLSKVLSTGAYDFIYSLVISLIMPIMYFVLILVYHKKRKINLKSALKFDFKINPIVVLLIVVISVICVACFFPIINMLYTVIEKLGFNVSGTVAFEMNNWWRLLIGAVIYCLLPAIMEEILFRGIMLKGLLTRAKPYVAILLSTVAFFIMHGTIQQTFYQLILGLILSLLGFYGVNIVYPIIFHFLNNLFVILLSYFNIGGYLNGFSLSVGGFFAGIGLLVLGGCLIAGIILIIRLLTAKKRANNVELSYENNNIIVIDEKEKLGFKALRKSFSIDEKFYFNCAWIVAIIMWVFNSI